MFSAAVPLINDLIKIIAEYATPRTQLLCLSLTAPIVATSKIYGREYRPTFEPRLMVQSSEGTMVIEKKYRPKARESYWIFVIPAGGTVEYEIERDSEKRASLKTLVDSDLAPWYHQEVLKLPRDVSKVIGGHHWCTYTRRTGSWTTNKELYFFARTPKERERRSRVIYEKRLPKGAWLEDIADVIAEYYY